MSTEEQLRAAFQAKAATATPAADALPRVRDRVARRRLVGRLQVSTAAAAVAAVAVGAVLLVDGDRGRDPVPPVTTTTPDASSSPAPSDAPSPPSSPSPAGPPATRAGGVPAEEFVAALDDGRVVSVSAQDGRITAVLLRLPAGRELAAGDLALSPDRRAVFLATQDPNEECGANIIKVDVTTGDVTDVTTGVNPQVSPDGRFLALERGCQTRDEWLVVRDLATGAERTFTNTELAEPTSEGPWYLADIAWHQDSRRIWVVMDWEDAPELRLLDPATDPSLREADDVSTRFGPRYLERRGDGLAYVHTCCYPESTEDRLLILRSAAGAEREVVRSPASGELSLLQVGPDGDVLYVQSGQLYRFDIETGAALDLGRSTAVARDW